VYLIVI